MLIHTEPSILSGKVVKIKVNVNHPQFPNLAGVDFTIEDWWDRVYGDSWMVAEDNPACLVYATRRGFSELHIPIDNEVLYGHTEDGFGHLVHITELEGG